MTNTNAQRNLSRLLGGKPVVAATFIEAITVLKDRVHGALIHHECEGAGDTRCIVTIVHHGEDFSASGNTLVDALWSACVAALEDEARIARDTAVKHEEAEAQNEDCASNGVQLTLI